MKNKLIKYNILGDIKLPVSLGHDFVSLFAMRIPHKNRRKGFIL